MELPQRRLPSSTKPLSKSDLRDLTVFFHLRSRYSNLWAEIHCSFMTIQTFHIKMHLKGGMACHGLEWLPELRVLLHSSDNKQPQGNQLFPSPSYHEGKIMGHNQECQEGTICHHHCSTWPSISALRRPAQPKVTPSSGPSPPQHVVRHQQRPDLPGQQEQEAMESLPSPPMDAEALMADRGKRPASSPANSPSKTTLAKKHHWAASDTINQVLFTSLP